jgi:UDP-N-acetyl-D-glucosamine dehydrogenase
MSYETLLARIQSKAAHVAVMGQGYVGLPLSMEVTHAGYHCIGVDVSRETVESLNAGRSHILDVSDQELSKARSSGRYTATANYADVAKADVISICVPTPLRKTKDPDVSYIQASVSAMRPYLKRDGVLVILESTTYPGTTDELVAEALAGDGLVLDENLFVAFSPERVDPGNPIYGLKNTPKVVGGVTPKSTDLIAAFYDGVVDEIHRVRSAREAEMVKLLENTFRAVNIALVNEMLLMCDRMGIDMWDVIQAASTKPFGFMPFYPGPGIGGHCIPLDPTYLSWKAKSYGFYNRFIELATDINGNMPRFVVQKLSRVMNDQSKALRGSNILLLGMAYKPNINDLRESPGLDIWQILVKEWGANVSYHDPYIPQIHKFEANSVELTKETLLKTDAVIIVTNHRDFDYEFVGKNASLILDARNATTGDAPNITRL